MYKMYTRKVETDTYCWSICMYTIIGSMHVTWMHVVCMYVCVYVCMYVRMYIYVCMYVFIKLHITTQSGPVILVILCHSH